MACKAPLLTPGHLASLTWSSWSPVLAALLLATLAPDAGSGPQVPQALDCISGLLPLPVGRLYLTILLNSGRHRSGCSQ